MHLIQPGNWRGARDVGHSLEKQRKPIIQHEKNRGTSLVLVKYTGTGPVPVPAQIPPEPLYLYSVYKIPYFIFTVLCLSFNNI